MNFKLLATTYRLSGYHYFNGGEYFSLGSKVVPIPFENIKYALISAPAAGSVGGVFHPDQQVTQDQYSNAHGLYAYTEILTSDSSTNTISGYIDARTSYYGTGSRRTGRNGEWSIRYVDLIIKHNYNH
ncbi:hypothetical protein [Campylobacter hyointestinalis]|uniref:hypothetical protein n=1 Tax=Campylobacter hyointestinalis TaxID=198 RepID=UPI00072934B6|nr:Uncharacterised protein [Campylobacter hyointestinalis subsp. hyointestinalis]